MSAKKQKAENKSKQPAPAVAQQSTAVYVLAVVACAVVRDTAAYAHIFA